MKPTNQKKTGIDFKSRIKLFFILFGLFLIVFVYAHMHIRMLNLGYKYILLQNKKLELQNRNYSLKKDLGNRLNLSEIDRISSEELGLVYPAGTDIYIIRAPKAIDEDKFKDNQNKETFQSLLLK